jgi:hypothetical protein
LVELLQQLQLLIQEKKRMTSQILAMAGLEATATSGTSLEATVKPGAGSKVTATMTSEVTVRGRGHLGSGRGGDRARSQWQRQDLNDGKLGGDNNSRRGLGGDNDGEHKLRGDGGHRRRDEGSEVNRWGAGFLLPTRNAKMVERRE